MSSSQPPAVLVVEDEERLLRLLQSVLMGIIVYGAADAASARRVAKRIESPISLLICDVVLPDQSGPELACELLRIFPSMKVLYISGYGADIIDGIKLDHDYTFLAKPFRLEEMLKKVSSLINYNGTVQE